MVLPLLIHGRCFCFSQTQWVLHITNGCFHSGLRAWRHCSGTLVQLGWKRINNSVFGRKFQMAFRRMLLGTDCTICSHCSLNRNLPPKGWMRLEIQQDNKDQMKWPITDTTTSSQVQQPARGGVPLWGQQGMQCCIASCYLAACHTAPPLAVSYLVSCVFFCWRLTQQLVVVRWCRQIVIAAHFSFPLSSGAPTVCSPELRERRRVTPPYRTAVLLSGSQTRQTSH